jgi:hypothetical protein
MSGVRPTLFDDNAMCISNTECTGMEDDILNDSSIRRRVSEHEDRRLCSGMTCVTDQRSVEACG